eukprot:Nitzschia sp. Nitz4//scaffold67_size101165//68176//69237//NITZ4_004534-RA/size101165-processed-gene-0.116-mRNA-1//-1//CDS//3329556489//7969//frame0
MSSRRRFLKTIGALGFFSIAFLFREYRLAAQTKNNGTRLERESSIQPCQETNKTTSDVSGKWPDEPYQGKHCLGEVSNGPTPVILMSQGRSGSHTIWRTLGVLSGLETEPHEYTGSNADQSKVFFESNEVVQNPNWIVNRLCHKQWNVLIRHPKPHASSSFVGFMWKPYKQDMDRPIVRQGLDVLRDLAQSGNPLELVRIIRSSRNPLDVYLARVKHKNYNLGSHCHSEKCVNDHVEASHNVTIDPQEALEDIQYTIAEESYVDQLLDQIGLSAVHTTYDELFYPESPESGSTEWNHVLQYLDKPSANSWEDINGAMQMKSTTRSRSHRDLIANFEEIRSVLQLADLAHLLRP